MQWSGGIRGSKSYADCRNNKTRGAKTTVQDCMPKGNGCDGGGGICIESEDACDDAFEGKSEFVTKKARESCKFVFNHNLHWNRPVHYTVVKCLKSLTDLTGLKPDDADDIGEPVSVKSSTTTM